MKSLGSWGKCKTSGMKDLMHCASVSCVMLWIFCLGDSDEIHRKIPKCITIYTCIEKLRKFSVLSPNFSLDWSSD